MAPGLDMTRVQQLYQDCCDLARYIAKARQEIAQLRPDELKAEKLPRAGQELEAIVMATEEATNTIMQAAEDIMAATPDDDPVAYKALADDACLKIFEACSFQDITGQRVSKVVKTIQHVEERLAALQAAWGPDFGDAPADDVDAPEGEAKLLNGPALEGEGVSQNEVDAMFAADDPSPSAARPAQGDRTASQASIDALFE